MSRYNVVPATGDGAVIKDVVTIKSKDGTVGVTTSNQTDWDLSIKDTVDRVQHNEQEIGQIKDNVAGIESSLTNKKDKQSAKEFNGSSTKTIKTITQNDNGELNVEFTNIAGGPINVAHDGTMTGDGTYEMPLSIQPALDVINANIAPKYDPTSIYPTVGTLRTYDNVLYRSKVAINTAEDWTAAHWDVANIVDSFLEIGEGYDVTAEFIPKYSNEVIRFGTIRYVPFLKMLSFNLVIEKRVNGSPVPIADISPYHTVDHYDVFKYDTDKYRFSEYLGSAPIYLGGNYQVDSKRPGPGCTFIWTDSSTINAQFVNYTELSLNVYQYCIFGNYLLA